MVIALHVVFSLNGASENIFGFEHVGCPTNIFLILRDIGKSEKQHTCLFPPVGIGVVPVLL